MISKQLFSAVTGFDVKNIYNLNSNPNLSSSDLPYSIRGIGDLYHINIYELAFKCKEWAHNKKYKLWSNYRTSQVQNIHGNYVLAEFYGTEPEAIFKACQWILDNSTIKG